MPTGSGSTGSTVGSPCEDQLARARIEYETMVKQEAALRQQIAVVNQNIEGMSAQIRAMPPSQQQSALGVLDKILNPGGSGGGQSVVAASGDEDTTERRGGGVSPILLLQKRKTDLGERLTRLEAKA